MPSRRLQDDQDGQPEINLGVVSGWGGTVRLARATSLGFAKEGRLFSMIFASADQAEGMSAFIEKRDPKFIER